MIKKTIKKYLTQFAYQAVCYAEEAVGNGYGKIKKDIAIDYLLGKLPAYCKPFTPFLKPLLIKILDEVVEQAVELLHELQKRQKERIEQEKKNG